MSSFGRRLAALTATTAVILSPLGIAASPAYADAVDAAKIHTVSPATAAALKWVEEAYENTADGLYTDPQQTLELDPKAPLGQGARFFHLGAFAKQVELYRSAALNSLKVDDITRLDYSTWAKQAGGRKDAAPVAKQPAYLRLSISSDGTGPQDTSLIFQPAENSTQGAVEQEKWQSWQTAGGRWLVIQQPAAVLPDQGYITLDQLVVAYPAATLANIANGALSVMAGDAGANQTYSKLGVDKIGAKVGAESFLWDLEPNAGTGSNNAVVVKNLDSAGWNTSAVNVSGNGGAGATTDVRQSLVIGPKKPVLGKGSAQLQVVDNADAAQRLRTTVLDGKALGDLRELKYSTYAEKRAGAGDPVQVPAYVTLAVDSDGDGVKNDTLVFEPVANAATPADLDNGAWKTWNALDGKLSIAGSLAPVQTLAAYLTENPNAEFVADAANGGQGAVSIVAGATGNEQRNAVFGVDAVSIGLSAVIDAKPSVATTTYDFEPTYTTPGVVGVKRNGPGAVTLTGTAGAGDTVEVRALTGESDYSTVLGTATAGNTGKWTLDVANMAATTTVKAWLADTYGGADIVSETATAEVTSIAPIVNNVKRNGPGAVTLTGTALAGENVEVRALQGAADWTTVLGTVTADDAGKWSLPLANVTATTTVRANLVDTELVSVNATVEVTAIKPTVKNAVSKGTGAVTLTGTAVAGDKVEVRALEGANDWTTVLGTATANQSGTWSLRVAKVTERTVVRAQVAGTELASASGRIDVAFNPTYTLTTKGGYLNGRVALDPAVAGVRVVWQQLDAKKKWVTIRNTTTNAAGVAELKWDTTKGRTYTVRAQVAGTAQVSGTTTKTGTVKSS